MGASHVCPCLVQLPMFVELLSCISCFYVEGILDAKSICRGAEFPIRFSWYFSLLAWHKLQKCYSRFLAVLIAVLFQCSYFTSFCYETLVGQAAPTNTGTAIVRVSLRYHSANVVSNLVEVGKFPAPWLVLFICGWWIKGLCSRPHIILAAWIKVRTFLSASICLLFLEDFSVKMTEQNWFWWR